MEGNLASCRKTDERDRDRKKNETEIRRLDLLNLRWERATKESTLEAAEAAIRSSAPTPKPAISLTVTLAMLLLC